MNVRTLLQLLRLTVPLALLTLMPLISASAAPFLPITQSGVFTTDDAHGKVSFNLVSNQTLYFYTTSYAGGPNADGTTAASGGFDPILTLFDNTNTYVDSNDDDLTNHYNRPKGGTGSSFDSYLALNLTAGNYTLVVTQSDNNAAVGSNINDPFSEDGQPNFTSSFASGRPGMFYDATGGQNTGNYTLNVSAAPPSVPEASTPLSLGLMLALGVGGFAFTARRRCATTK